MKTATAGLNLISIPPLRLLSSAAMTVYLSVYIDFQQGTMQVTGFLRARRMR